MVRRIPCAPRQPSALRNPHKHRTRTSHIPRYGQDQPADRPLALRARLAADGGPPAHFDDAEDLDELLHEPRACPRDRIRQRREPMGRLVDQAYQRVRPYTSRWRRGATRRLGRGGDARGGRGARHGRGGGRGGSEGRGRVGGGPAPVGGRACCLGRGRQWGGRMREGAWGRR